MKPAQFQYHRPTSAAEAVDLAAELEEAEFMAGNQSLGIVMSNRLATPANIVDLSRIDELDFVVYLCLFVEPSEDPRPTDLDYTDLVASFETFGRDGDCGLGVDGALVGKRYA